MEAEQVLQRKASAQVSSSLLPDLEWFSMQVLAKQLMIKVSCNVFDTVKRDLEKCLKNQVIFERNL